MARVEAEHEEGESEGIAAFDRTAVGGGFRLALGSVRGVRTELAVAAGLAVGVVGGVAAEDVDEVGNEVGTSSRARRRKRGKRRADGSTGPSPQLLQVEVRPHDQGHHPRGGVRGRRGLGVGQP